MALKTWERMFKDAMPNAVLLEFAAQMPSYTSRAQARIIKCPIHLGVFLVCQAIQMPHLKVWLSPKAQYENSWAIRRPQNAPSPCRVYKGPNHLGVFLICQAISCALSSVARAMYMSGRTADSRGSDWL